MLKTIFEELIVTKVTKKFPASKNPINPNNKIFVKDRHRAARRILYINSYIFLQIHLNIIFHLLLVLRSGIFPP